MTLSSVHYSLPTGGFFFKINRLKKLFLYDCMVNQSDLESTVSNSMFLESLILVGCQGLTILKISNLNLQELAILPLHDDLEINAPNLLSLVAKNLLLGLTITNSCRLVRALFQNMEDNRPHFYTINRDDVLAGFYIKIRPLLSQLHHLQLLVTDQLLPSFLDEALYQNGQRFPGFKNLKELCFLCHRIRGSKIPSWLNFLII